MRLSHGLAALAAFALPLPAAAQADDEQVWINYTVMGSIKDRLIYFAEAQPRIGDGVDRLQQLLLRPAIGWKLSDRVSVYQGYVHVVLPIRGGRDRNEERSFQQLTWTVPLGRTAEFQSRSRFEQRWLSNGRDMGLRAREMVRGEAAFAPSGRGVRALTYAELFVALDDTDWGARKGFDQLRSFAGVEVPVGGRSTVELGYLNQLIGRGDAQRMNHVASLSLFIRP